MQNDMSYALQTLWHEKSRYAAGVGAVAFSAVLMALQFGLMLGLFTITSTPLDHTDPRNVWVGSKDVKAVDLGQPIPVSHIGRIGERPGVMPPEPYIAHFANFQKPNGGTDLCFLLGHAGPAGASDVLDSNLRTALTEPFAIVMDESDLERMGMRETGDTAKINGREVRLVGTVRGLKSLAAPWIFCSQTTAREVLSVTNPIYADHTTYLLARCDTKQRATQVVQELSEEYPEMTICTADEFSTRTRWYWLLRTKAGIALGYAALLGLLVGAIITAQTLYSATLGSAKEFATLLALGIPRIKIYQMVLAQSFWVGIIGVILAYPVIHVLALVAERAGTRVVMRWELLLGAALVTMLTALLSGVVALRSVKRIEPMSLLR